uniref:acyl-CoA synthetase n=1 Tax=Orrella sp. TaxID=1921583 RepID=UPI0040476C6F
MHSVKNIASLPAEHGYVKGLEKNAANHVAFSPICFLERSALVFPKKTAIIHGALRQNWSDTLKRSRQLASGLQSLGIQTGDTVAVMLPNTPPMVEAHFGVPMSGAILNCLNTRLDANSIAFMLNHGEAKLVIFDSEFAPVMKEALAILKREHGREPMIFEALDEAFVAPDQTMTQRTYEALVASGDPSFEVMLPEDEWQSICLNYTSGTTGDPKGVVYSHRGAAMNAISNILEWDMPKHPIYLWTLPLFHCNGWCFPWSVAARAGVNVCLRKIDAQTIFDLIREHGVTHYCAAPIVHGLLVNAPDAMKTGLPAGVKAMVAGAAPPAAMIEGMETMGFELTHVYGLTEVYGPAAVCVKHEDWGTLDISERARLNSRQGVRYHLQADVKVLDPETMAPVPWDGETMGEIMFRGNITMKGYLKNPKATDAAFAGGWFHSGDLAVQYPDGYVKIKDRSKDIIISGGENISSIEVEDVLYRHPAVLAAAVVAKPDPKWGETPCAFLELKPGVSVTPEEIISFCKLHMAHFKVPKNVIFGEVPKTSTGKIQKFELRKHASTI